MRWNSQVQRSIDFFANVPAKGFSQRTVANFNNCIFPVSSSTSPTSSSSSSSSASSSSSNASSVALSTASQLHHHLRVRQLHHLHSPISCFCKVILSTYNILYCNFCLMKTTASDMNRYYTWSVIWRECPMTQNGCTANSVTWKHPASLQTLVSSAWKQCQRFQENSNSKWLIHAAGTHWSRASTCKIL